MDDTLYRTLFELSPQPMLIYNCSTEKIFDANKAAEELYGYDKEELLNSQPMIFSNTFLADLKSFCKNSPDKRQGSNPAVDKHYGKGSMPLHLQVQTTEIEVKGEKAILVVLTETKHVLELENQLTDLNAKFEDAQRIAQTGYWRRALDEDISEWSGQMFEIYGQDPFRFVPTYENVMACFHPDDRYLLGAETFASLSLTGFNDFEHRIITPGNHTRWVFQRLQLQSDGSGHIKSITGVIQDITERKNSEQKFKAVFDNATDAILMGDDQGRCLDYNQAAVAMFGYSKPELDNMGLNQLLKFPGEKQYSILWKRFLSGRIRSGIMELQKKDGSVIKASFNARPGILPGVHLCVITDVTEQARQQKLLRASERRFKALVQEGADLVSILDHQGRYKFIGESCRQVLGNQFHQFIGQCAFDLIHPEDHSSVTVLFAKLTDLRRIQTEPFRFRDFNGNWRWLRTIATNLSEDPAVEGIVVNSRDITEAVLKTNQLKNSNERYRLIMNAAHEAILDWDIIEDKIEWGSGFLDNFGYNLSETSSYHFYNSIHPKDQNRVWAEIEEAMSSSDKKMIFSECRFYKSGRSVAQIQYRLIFMRDHKGMVYRAVGSLRDITDHQRNLVMISQQNDKLREIAWSQSHVVRAPLSRMMGLIDLIKNYSHSQQEVTELLELVLQSAHEFDRNIREISKKTM